MLIKNARSSFGKLGLIEPELALALFTTNLKSSLNFQLRAWA